MRPKSRYRFLPIIMLIIGLSAYWLLPIRGSLWIEAGLDQSNTAVHPRLWIETNGNELWIYVQDTAPLVDVLLTLDGITFARDIHYWAGAGPWTWRWRVHEAAVPATARFYHSCAEGCQERLRVSLGAPVVQPTSTTSRPTKLGAVFADPERNWHGRAAWTVELTYSERGDDPDWSIDGLAARVYRAKAVGLRVIVRIAYDQGQSMPPHDDQQALSRYLYFCKQLAQDDRLESVDAFMIGNGYNTLGENSGSLEGATTPEWYARIFNGYGLAPERSDNIMQIFAAAGSQAWILVGPVTPWNSDQTGSIEHKLEQPWLTYFQSVVYYINLSTVEKSKYSIALPRLGFAVQAPGRPELATDPAQEPQTNLYIKQGSSAQAGFRVYQDWLTSINSYATTTGAPVFITSTNTYTADIGIPPIQNYPQGWLTAALQEIANEPQIVALCWFVDRPFGGMWHEWSLSEPQGALYDAAEEFDQLLQE